MITKLCLPFLPTTLPRSCSLYPSRSLPRVVAGKYSIIGDILFLLQKEGVRTQPSKVQFTLKRKCAKSLPPIP